MRRLGTLFTSANSTVGFRATNPSNLTTYVGVLKRYDGSANGAPVLTWTPSQLAAGVTAVLTPAVGYDILVIPEPSKTPAALTLEVAVSNDQRREPLTDIDSQESIGWSIFLV